MLQEVEGMYWETYDDQDSADFDYIGVPDKVVEPIGNMEAQAAEFRRLFGENIEIFVYRKNKED